MKYILDPVSYTHLDVYKRHVHTLLATLELRVLRVRLIESRPPYLLTPAGGPDAGGNVDQVRQECPGHGEPLGGAGVFEVAQQLRCAADQLAGVGIREHELPLQPDGGTPRGGEVDRHGASILSLIHI